jgi:preprotein translocase subunit SecB
MNYVFMYEIKEYLNIFYIYCYKEGSIDNCTPSFCPSLLFEYTPHLFITITLLQAFYIFIIVT